MDCKGNFQWFFCTPLHNRRPLTLQYPHYAPKARNLNESNGDIRATCTKERGYERTVRLTDLFDTFLNVDVAGHKFTNFQGPSNEQHQRML